MLKIYGVLNSRASRNIWMAMEMGLEFEHVPVVQASRLTDPLAPDAALNTDSLMFRKISANGRVPVVDDDGLILHESLAINLHFAQKDKTNPLAPRDDAEDAQMTMWTLWAATECEPFAVTIIVNKAIRPMQDRDEPALLASVAALRGCFQILETALDSGGGYLVGQRFTVADLNLAEVLRYAQPASELFNDYPTVAAWMSACQTRPAFREVTRRKEAEPLPDGWQSAYCPKCAGVHT